MIYNTLPTIELKLINIGLLLCVCVIMYLIGLASNTNKKRLKALWILLAVVVVIPGIACFNGLKEGVKEYEEQQQAQEQEIKLDKHKEDPTVKFDPTGSEDLNTLSYKLNITHDNIQDLKNIKANIIIDNKEYVFDLK